MVDKDDFWTSIAVAAFSLVVMLSAVLSPWQGLKDTYKLLLVAGPVAMATIASFGLLKDRLVAEQHLRQAAEQELRELRLVLAAGSALAALPADEAPQVGTATPPANETIVSAETLPAAAADDASAGLPQQPLAAGGGTSPEAELGLARKF